MKIAVVSPKVPANIADIVNVNDYVFYACDSAVVELYKQNIPIELAIGDFDSLKDDTILKTLKTIKLGIDKDDSDTAYALRHAYQQTDDVVLIGGIKGDRVDHLIANIMLLEKYPDLVIMDDTNIIKKLMPGSYKIKKEKMKYLSVFPLEDVVINLDGVKFPLDNEKLFKYDPLGLSNEITGDHAQLELISGELLLIESTDK